MFSILPVLVAHPFAVAGLCLIVMHYVRRVAGRPAALVDDLARRPIRRLAVQLAAALFFQGLLGDVVVWGCSNPVSMIFLLCIGWRFVHVMRLRLAATAAQETPSSSAASPARPVDTDDNDTDNDGLWPLRQRAPKVCAQRSRLWGEPYFSPQGRVDQAEIEAGTEVQFFVQPVSTNGDELTGLAHLQRFVVDISCGGVVEIVPVVRYVVMRANGSIEGSYSADELTSDDDDDDDDDKTSTSRAARVNVLQYQFTPKKMGRLEVRVGVQSPATLTALRGSPFAFDVQAGMFPHANYTTVSVSTCVQPVGGSFAVVLQCADQFGNPIGRRLPDWLLRKFTFNYAACYGQASPATWSYEFAALSGGNVVCAVRPGSEGTLICSVALEEHPLLLDMAATGEVSLSALQQERYQALQRDIQKPSVRFRVRQLVYAGQQHDGVDVSFWPARRELRVATAGFLTLFSRTLYSFRLGRGMSLRLGPQQHAVSLAIARDEAAELLFASEADKQLFHCTFMSLLTWRGRSWDERRAELGQLFRAAFPPLPAGPPLKIVLDRSNLVQSALAALGPLSDDAWRQKWSISFANEVGLDEGGLTAELFTVLSKELFSLLFFPFSRATAEAPSVSSSSSSSSSQASSSSSSSSRTLGSTTKYRGEFSVVRLFPSPYTGLDDAYFSLAGKLCAKAMWDYHVHKRMALIPVHFTTAFYKQLLQLPTHYTDFATDDPAILSVLNVEVTDDSMLEFFVDTFRPDGSFVESVALRPPPCPVTEANKIDYLKAVAEYRFCTSVKKEFQAFYQGFSAVLGPKLLDHLSDNFSDIELELLLCGENKVDLREWRAPGNIRYFGCKPDSQIVRWFFVIVENMTNPELCALLQFVTGSSQIPLGGFGKYEPKFSIAIDMRLSRTSCPIAHTCFNQLVLPEYTSFEVFSSRLMLAITEGSVGFELK